MPTYTPKKKKIEQSYNKKKMKIGMQSVSAFMYTSVFVDVAGKIKNIGPLKDMGFLCFHHAPPPPNQLSTVDIYFIRYILWIDMSEVFYKKKIV